MSNPNSDNLWNNQRFGKSPLEEFSDEVLIHAIAGGDTSAMGLLYERYSRIIYAFAYRMVSDHVVAEDLLQEAFLSVWRRAISYSPESGTVRSWLIAIVHHRTIDFLRTVRRRSSSLEEISLQEIEHDGEREALQDAWAEEWRLVQEDVLKSVQNAQVRKAMQVLPTEQRLVLELAYFQGWTHSEIAEGCHIPLGTVKARMRLGMQHLKQILEQMELDSEQRVKQIASNQISLKKEVSRIELFALVNAEIEDGNFAIVNKNYTLQTGISQIKLVNFTSEPFNLSEQNYDDVIPFDILLHVSANVETIGEYYQHLDYNTLNTEPQLISFSFRLRSVGQTSLVVNFYWKQQWLKTLRLDFDGVEQIVLSSSVGEN